MNNDCLFCLISQGRAPAQVVFEDNRVIAFKDINPKAPIHLLIIPKKHYFSLNDVSEKDEGLLGHLIFVASRLAQEKGLKTTGYRLIINTGPDSGQQIFHLHLHLLAGRQFSWPPG